MPSARGLLKWLRLVETLAPGVAAVAAPELAPVVFHIVNGIHRAEQLAEPGSQKLQVAVETAMEGLRAVNTLRPGTVADEGSLRVAVLDVVEGTVRAVNAITKPPTSVDPAPAR